MVNGRRVIAICVSKDGNEENLVYINKLYEMAKERNYITIVYSMVSDIYSHREDSEQIFHMIHAINYSYVDAVIIVKDYMLSDSTVDAIVEDAMGHDKPRIIIGGYHENAFSIQYQGDRCFESIVRHVVEHHKCRNVYFMAGIENDEATDGWIEIYKKVLSENNIEFNPAKIGYGEYWAIPTHGVMARWNQTWIDKADYPDAIICANDAMALGVCEKLEEYGFIIPENIIVTGFDGTVQAKYHHPRITTGEREQDATCDIVMEVLETSFSTGDFFKMSVSQQYIMNTCQSCGCDVNHSDEDLRIINSLYNRIENARGHESYIYRMAGKSTEASDKYEISKVFSNYLFPNSFIALRQGVFEKDDDYTEVDFDETLDVITYNVPIRTGQKKMFPYGIFFPDYETLDRREKYFSVYPITYDERLYGFFVAVGITDVNNIYNINRLVNMTNVSMNMVRKNYQYKMANQNLTETHIREPLTGLFNMKGFVKAVEERYISNKDDRKFILFALDIERLKSINEGFGHEEGDKALVTLAEILRSNTSVEDIVAKYGVDEYLVAILTKEDTDYNSYKFINGVLSSLNNHNKANGKPYSLGISYESIVGAPGSVEELNNMIKEVTNLKRINKELHEEGKDQDISEKEMEEYKLFDDIMRNNKLRYMFQPLVDAKTGDVYAYEALMRTSEGVHMSPVRMIELAMKYNRLDDIEHATMNNVFKYASEHKEAFGDKKIFVNSVITNHLSKEEFEELLEKYGNVKDQMVVEMTEHTDVSIEKYKELGKFLAERGLQIAIDDYGTGYSNTARIIQYQPDYVKIDRLLINGINSDFKKQHFVENIIKYAHENGFKAIGEGVETSAELKTLLCMDVDLIQGYYTARPSFEVAKEIDKDIKNEMLRDLENISSDTVRRTYVTGNNNEVDIESFNVAKFNEIYVSSQNVHICGKSGVCREVNLKFENGKDYEVVLENVWLNPAHVENVISIGEDSNVQIVLKGENYIESGGIYVPKTSSLRMMGDGTLTIMGIAENGYGIGADYKHSCGNIYIDLPAGINIKVEGENGVGIGSGFNEGKSTIEIVNTPVTVAAACVKAVGIGSLYDESNVKIDNCNINLDIKGRMCDGIGSIDGSVNITIDNSKLEVESSGDAITAVGSTRNTSGLIAIRSTDTKIRLIGKEGCCIGADAGELAVELSDLTYDFKCEGAYMVCLGTRSKEASINVLNCHEQIEYQSANYLAYGAADDKINMQLV